VELCRLRIAEISQRIITSDQSIKTCAFRFHRDFDSVAAQLIAVPAGVPSFVTSFYGNGGMKFPDRVPAEHCLVLLVPDCVFLQISLNVQANMIEQNNGQALSPTHNKRPRYTGELLLRTRPKVYRQIVRLLSEGVSANQICKLCHVTRETVRAVERREATEISARKKTLTAMLANVAELGASRMEETIGKASLRDATIGTGVAVDKMLALTGQMPALQIANIVMPSEAEREERRAIDAKLDAIARRLTTSASPAAPLSLPAGS
jgi:hypothetical protein